MMDYGNQMTTSFIMNVPNKKSVHRASAGASDEPVQIGTWTRSSKKTWRTYGYFYTWNFDDGQKGFIVQEKNLLDKDVDSLSLYLDKNGNGTPDKRDVLIFGGTAATEGALLGKLLGRSEVGIITAKVFVPEDDHNAASDPGIGVGINSLGYEHFSLLNASGVQVIHEHGMHYMDSMAMG